jgi:hypothetical protein
MPKTLCIADRSKAANPTASRLRHCCSGDRAAVRSPAENAGRHLCGRRGRAVFALFRRSTRLSARCSRQCNKRRVPTTRRLNQAKQRGQSDAVTTIFENVSATLPKWPLIQALRMESSRCEAKARPIDINASGGAVRFVMCSTLGCSMTEVTAHLVGSHLVDLSYLC